MRAQSKMSLGTHSQKWLSVALLCCFGVGLAVAQEVAPRSKVFPVSDEAMTCNLIDGAPNLEELCYPLADAAKVTPEDSDKWAAVVEVPAYVDLLDATDQFDPAMHAPVVSDVTRDGKPYKRYQFKGLFRSAVQVKIGWEVLYSTWVPRPTPADRAAPGVFAWHFVTPWGVEAERVAPIQLLPMPLETQQPKRIHVRLWAPSNVRISPAKLEPVLAFLQRVGVTDLVAGALTAESLIAAREKGMRIVGDQAGITGFPAAENARTDNPDYRNQDHLGRPIATGGWPYDTDLQWILDEKGKPWAGYIENYRNFALGKEVVSQDIEWNANWDNGFSPAGIRAFAARFGLDAAALTPAKIWAEHRTQWGISGPNRRWPFTSCSTTSPRPPTRPSGWGRCRNRS